MRQYPNYTTSAQKGCRRRTANSSPFPHNALGSRAGRWEFLADAHAYNTAIIATAYNRGILHDDHRPFSRLSLGTFPRGPPLFPPSLWQFDTIVPLNRVRHDIYCKSFYIRIRMSLLHITCIPILLSRPCNAAYSLPSHACCMHSSPPCSMYICATQLIPQSCILFLHGSPMVPHDTRHPTQGWLLRWARFPFSFLLAFLLPFPLSLHWLLVGLPPLPFI